MSTRVSTIDELAAAIGKDRTTLYRWKREWGLDDLFDETKGGWDPEEVRAWAVDMKRTRRAVLRNQDLDLNEDDATTADGTNWQHQFRKAKAILATLQARKLQETLIDRAEVERMFSTRVAELTQTLESLSSQLAPRIAPMTEPAEIQAELREAFHQLRDHFARD